jgi:hypothetical protein
MSTDLQDLLREGLDRLTAGATVPDGLVGQAQRHNRQRRTKIRAAIAAGTAVAAAAVAVTVSLAATGSQPSSAPVRTETVADVVTRTERALANEANQGNAIQVTRLSGRHATFGLIALAPNGPFANPSPTQRLPGAPAAVTAQRMVSWTYHDLWLQEGFSAAGRLVFVNVNGPITLRSGKQVAGNYGAAYPVHIRWRTVLGGSSGPAPKPTCQTVPTDIPSWRATIAKALSCGLYSLRGRQWVNGVDALTLVSQPRGMGYRDTVWVNPSTYLPVRRSSTFLSGPSRGEQLVTDYQFLPPTRADLAMLHAVQRRASIPATFRLLPAKYVILAGGV